MKKQTKKLTLAKESLQNLENLEDKNLEQVGGGYMGTRGQTVC